MSVIGFIHVEPGPPLGQAIIHPRLNSRHDVVDSDTCGNSLPITATGDDGRTQTMVEMVTAANHIDDPDQLQVGQVALFPSLD